MGDEITGPRQRTLDAYEATRPKHPSQRQRIFASIEASGRYGFTLDELMVKLSLNQSAGTRLAELRRDGKIEDSGETRVTRAGHRATVWVATRPGEA